MYVDVDVNSATITMRVPHIDVVFEFDRVCRDVNEHPRPRLKNATISHNGDHVGMDAMYTGMTARTHRNAPMTIMLNAPEGPDAEVTDDAAGQLAAALRRIGYTLA
jgi:hypothetical protein